MSDYRDTRGGAYDHVSDFGNPQPPQVRDKETPPKSAVGRGRAARTTPWSRRGLSVAGGSEERAQRTPEQRHRTTTEEVTGHVDSERSDRCYTCLKNYRQRSARRSSARRG
jgi:hypothetical protein